MKYTAIVLTIFLAIAGSAFAQTLTPPDTSVTAAAQGSYPAGTSFNGVPLGGFHIGSGAIIAGDGSTADGKLGIALLGISTPLGQQIINVDATITGGSSTGSVATISGTCSVDMGTGAAPLTGVPIIVTIGANPDGSGTVGVVLGAVTLPTSALDDGTLAVEAMQ
jgi:hypothetical protein